MIFRNNSSPIYGAIIVAWYLKWRIKSDIAIYAFTIKGSVAVASRRRWHGDERAEVIAPDATIIDGSSARLSAWSHCLLHHVNNDKIDGIIDADNIASPRRWYALIILENAYAVFLMTYNGRSRHLISFVWHYCQYGRVTSAALARLLQIKCASFQHYAAWAADKRWLRKRQLNTLKWRIEWRRRYQGSKLSRRRLNESRDLW